MPYSVESRLELWHDKELTWSGSQTDLLLQACSSLAALVTTLTNSLRCDYMHKENQNLIQPNVALGNNPLQWTIHSNHCLGQLG